MIEDEFTTKTGHTLDDLGQEARQLFLILHLKEPGEWMDVDRNTRARWIEKVVEPVAMQVTNEISTIWNNLTARIYGLFFARSELEFYQESRYTRLAWQAVARHLVNMMTCQDADDIRSMGPNVDAYWKKWLSEQLQKKESESAAHAIPPEEDEED